MARRRGDIDCPAKVDIAKACRSLARKDKAFRIALKAINNEPHIRARPGGYEGLFRIIVEQQVSVPSAQAILKRCTENIPTITPQTVMRLSEDELRSCGLSGPKIRYLRFTAEAIEQGDLCFTTLAGLNDEEAIEHLCKVKGIGPWTAAIYLLFCDNRLDIWPRNDVALLAAWTAAANLEERPVMKEFDDMAARFAPFRGIAAHILWTYYAVLRNRAPI